MEQNFNKGNLLFFDFFSFPHNPEELFTLLYLLYKNETYEIYKGLHNETRDIYCIKIIQLDKASENSSKSLFQKIKQETLLMKSFKNCENITQYYGSFLSFKTKSVWLIYEYCPVGSTYDIMRVVDRPLKEEEISIIMNDIIHALIYMHQLNIIHKNIKMTNILFDNNGNSKLNNFSKSIQKLSNNEKFIIQKDEINDVKYDILLLGTTCIELYKGLKNNSFNRKKFLEKLTKNHNSNTNSELKLILYENNTDKYISKEFIEFIQKCTEPNLYKRPTAFELSNHPFIKQSINSTYKTHFKNLIKESIEKIENYKKENFVLNSSKIRFGNFYKSIYCNTKNTNKSNISNNEKSSNNISNLINNTNDLNTINVDKLAEFRIEQMKREEVLEYDSFTNKELYYSNINNTGINNDTIDSNKTIKESPVFGKRAEKSCKILKKSLMTKKLNKKEDKKDIKINGFFEENEGVLNKKDSDEIEFKANLERLNKYEDLFKSRLSNNNNNDKMFFNDDSINVSSNIEKHTNSIISNNNSINIINIKDNKPENYIPFSEIKCDIIRLGSSIKYKKNKKTNNTSQYSLKDSVNKYGDNNNSESKDNNLINIQKKFLLSFGNNSLNEIDKKMDSKDKNNKNDRSTCFSSLKSPIYNKINLNNGMKDIFLEKHKSCKKILHFRKNNYENDSIEINNNTIHNDNDNDIYSYDFHSERCKDPFLYKYINDSENPKENKTKIKTSNIIKIDKIFKNKEKINKY